MNKYRQALLTTYSSGLATKGAVTGKISVDEMDLFQQWIEKEVMDMSDEDLALMVCRNYLELSTEYAKLIGDYAKSVARLDDLSEFMLAERVVH